MQTITLILNLPSTSPAAALAFLGVQEKFASADVTLVCFHQENTLAEIADFLLENADQSANDVVVHHSCNHQKLIEIWRSPLKAALESPLIESYYLPKDEKEIMSATIAKKFKCYSKLVAKYNAVPA